MIAETIARLPDRLYSAVSLTHFQQVTLGSNVSGHFTMTQSPPMVVF